MKRMHICVFYLIFVQLQDRLQEAVELEILETKKNSGLVIEKSLVDRINTVQNTWKAKRNEFFESMSKEEKKKFFGSRRMNDDLKLKHTRPYLSSIKDIPDSFDSREKWPMCTSIGDIRDQSSCGSCWAFGATESMTDRICIASNGSVQIRLSARDLLSCCTECGDGCEGADPYKAWQFWVKEGIVTGSDYVSNRGCQPYPFPPCAHHAKKEAEVPPCSPSYIPTPECLKRCSPGYHPSYMQDKYYGQKSYLVPSEESEIQKEIIKYGPVEVSFYVYEDFEVYDGGIYQHKIGEEVGMHDVKIIGWGIEDGVKYWTIANSWNSGWGENGFFRIVRGKNESGIEGYVMAGLPKL